MATEPAREPSVDDLRERIEELTFRAERAERESAENEALYVKAVEERLSRYNAALDLAVAGRRLVNAGLPIVDGKVTLDLEHPFWIAARNMRATLGVHFDITNVDGEQDRA